MIWPLTWTGAGPLAAGFVGKRWLGALDLLSKRKNDSRAANGIAALLAATVPMAMAQGLTRRGKRPRRATPPDATREAMSGTSSDVRNDAGFQNGGTANGREFPAWNGYGDRRHAASCIRSFKQQARSIGRPPEWHELAETCFAGRSSRLPSGTRCDTDDRCPDNHACRQNEAGDGVRQRAMQSGSRCSQRMRAVMGRCSANPGSLNKPAETAPALVAGTGMLDRARHPIVRRPPDRVAIDEGARVSQPDRAGEQKRKPAMQVFPHGSRFALAALAAAKAEAGQELSCRTG